MRPIEFKGQNLILGKNQPEYQPLPAFVAGDHKGNVTTCWQLDEADLAAIAANGGKIWIQQYTFRRGFQPQLPSVEMPDHLRAHQEIEQALLAEARESVSEVIVPPAKLDG